jgi:hypothetical protein
VITRSGRESGASTRGYRPEHAPRRSRRIRPVEFDGFTPSRRS